MANDPKAQAAKMLENLPEKTGKTLKQWLALVKKLGAEKHGEIVKWLKAEHGVTHGFANLIAHEYRASNSGAATDTGDDEQLVEAQYAGKESLRPIYEALRKHVAKFGKDVEFAPKKSYVSIRRSKQFALIQPSTKTRIDVGIQHKGKKPTKRLEASGSWNSMVSHRVRLTDVDQVDDQLIEWLREAYEQA